MASSRSTGSKGGRKSVSLADEDRRYLSESLDDARGRGAAGEESEDGLFEALERFGLSSDRVERLRDAKIDEMDVRESIDKAQEYLAEQIENARDYARENPKKVIGGAAGVLVGASLLAMALRRASGEEKAKPRVRAARRRLVEQEHRPAALRASGRRRRSKWRRKMPSSLEEARRRDARNGDARDSPQLSAKRRTASG